MRQAMVDVPSQPVRNRASNPRAVRYAYEQGGWVNNRWTAYTTYSTITGATDGPFGITSYARATVTQSRTNFGFHLADNPEAANPGAGTIYRVPVTPGETFTVSTFHRCAVPSTWLIKGKFATSGFTWTGSATSGVPVLIPANTWVRVWVTLTAPEDAADVALSVISNVDNLPVGCTFDGTGLMISDGPTLPEYMDGTRPWARFVGAADASPSIGYPNTIEAIAGRPAAYFDARYPLGKFKQAPTISDDFNRANGAPGNGWIARRWDGAAVTITPAITSNQLGFSVVNQDSYALRDFGQSDMVVEADYIHKAGQYGGIVARASATNSASIWFRSSQSTGWMRLIRDATGTAISTSTVNASLVDGQTYRLRIEAIGNTVRFFVDGVLNQTYIDDNAEPILRQNTHAGVGGFNSTTLRWDNFIAYTTPPDGTLVAQWADLSGNGRHLTQATVASQPKFRALSRNLLPPGVANSTDAALPLRTHQNMSTSPSVSTSTVWSASEGNSFLMTVTGTSTGTPFGARVASSTTPNRFSVVPNELLSAEVTVNLAGLAAARPVQLYLEFFDSTGNWITSPVLATSNNASGIYRLAGATTVPANAVKAHSMISIGSPAVGDFIYIDQWGVYREAVPAAWIPPTFLPNGSILFDGVDDTLAALISQRAIDPITLYAVAAINKPTSSAEAIAEWRQGIRLRRLGDSTFGIDVNSGPSFVSSSRAFPPGKPFVVSAVNYGDRTVQTAIDGVDGAVSAAGGGTNTTVYTQIEMARRDATTFLSGEIAALLIFQQAHNNATRDQIERWLGAQFGITVA